ncbi:MAG: Ku protein [Methanotrichaceae archaeon]
MAEVLELTKERQEEKAKVVPPRAIWSGSLRMGLVNIPVNAVSITRDTHISLRMLHRSCETPISFKRFCQEGEEVPLRDIVYGYPLDRKNYVVLEKKEIDAAKPGSKDTIDLDRFVNFFQIDPHYFEKTYLLMPNRSDEAYALLRAIMEKTGKAAIGRMTLVSRERVVLVHYYQGAIVATILRYSDEIVDPQTFEQLKNLPEPNEMEMKLAKDIVDGLSGEPEMSAYKDEYNERIQDLVRSKMGEKVVTIEKKKEKPAAKSLMEALRITAESLK